MAGASVWVRGANKQSRDRMVELAKEDLAERIGQTPDAITLISAEAVTWYDASLGYPQPGRKWVDGYVPGYQIFLSFSGREYEYHSSFNRVVFVPAGKGQSPLPATVM